MYRKKGFTLIELMVVIAIIAVLAAVIAPQVFRQVAKGRAASVESFYNSVKTAATSYFSDTGAWPASCNPANCNTIAGVNGGFVAAATNNPGWDGPYLDRWPTANGNPFAGNYNWVNTLVGGACFGAANAERFIVITNVVQAADRNRIDVAIDGAAGAATGKVRIGAVAPCGAGANSVSIVVSRDGPIT